MVFPAWPAGEPGCSSRRRAGVDDETAAGFAPGIALRMRRSSVQTVELPDAILQARPDDLLKRRPRLVETDSDVG